MESSSKPSKVTARCRVQVTIELDAGSSWGDTTTTQQVFDQAGRETVQGLRNLFNKADRSMEIIGNPKVLMVISERGY